MISRWAEMREKFLPEPVKYGALQAGDIVIAHDDRVAHFDFVVSTNDDQLSRISLVAWDISSGKLLTVGDAIKPLPFDPEQTLRRISDELFIETAQKQKADGLSAYQYHGSILEYDDGDIGLVLRSAESCQAWSLKDGVHIVSSRKHPKYIISQWSIVWKSGDDGVKLCDSSWL